MNNSKMSASTLPPWSSLRTQVDSPTVASETPLTNRMYHRAKAMRFSLRTTVEKSTQRALQ